MPGAADPWPCPPPPYPADAASRGIEGVLEVEVEVLPDGTVGQVRLLSSSGSPILDRCALAWIPARWGPFQPMKNEAGVPLAYTFSRPVRFSLTGR
jgi:protein TonB